MKALNDELQMRCDWVLPICGGQRAGQGRDGAQGAPDAEARGAALPRAARLHQAGRRRARPVLRHRHDRRGGEAAGPALDRHRARERPMSTSRASGSIRRCRSTKARCRRWPQARRSRASPSALLVESGLCRAGTVLTDAKRRWTATRPRRRLDRLRRACRARSTRSARRCRARRPATAGPSGMSSRAARCKPLDALRQQHLAAL